MTIIYEMTVKAFIKQLLVYIAYIAGPLITGQTISYLEGDDAWWDAEIPFPIGLPRFWKLSENTVYDWYSGLEWVADPSEMGGAWGTPGNPEPMTWDEGIEACNNLNYSGRNDWRMPNSNEIETLIDYGMDHPATSKKTFKNTKSDDYWSSSMTNHGCENEFKPNFAAGNKSWDPNKEEKKYVRPVRMKLAPRWLGMYGWKGFVGDLIE